MALMRALGVWLDSLVMRGFVTSGPSCRTSCRTYSGRGRSRRRLSPCWQVRTDRVSIPGIGRTHVRAWGVLGKEIHFSYSHHYVRDFGIVSFHVCMLNVVARSLHMGGRSRKKPICHRNTMDYSIRQGQRRLGRRSGGRECGERRDGWGLCAERELARLGQVRGVPQERVRADWAR